MKEKISPLDVTYSHPALNGPAPEFDCDNLVINRWFCDKSQSDHHNFNCRVTYAFLRGDPRLAGFFSLCVKVEPQRHFAGHSFFETPFFEDDKVTTVHLRWLAVRHGLERRGLATIMMGQVIEDAYDIVMKAGAHALMLSYTGIASQKLYEKFRFLPYDGKGGKSLFLVAKGIIDIVEGR